MSKSVEKGLWDIAIEQSLSNENNKSLHEGSVFVVGSRNAGKTSMLNRFLERDEAPKSTVALEYTFARKARNHNMAKDIGHIWELGGGTWLSKLMEIPINPDTLRHLGLVIMVDLSQPNQLWFTLETLLTSLRNRVESVVNQMRTDHPSIRDDLKNEMWERLGIEHPDKDLMNPFPLPLTIIGGKYDEFQELDSEKRKVISKTLRFVAHVNGANLNYFSIKQEGLITKCRSVISHYLFTTSFGTHLQTDHNKPLVITAGQDTMQHIGSPPLADGDIGKISARTPIDLWKAAYVSMFPQENISDPSQVPDPAKDYQYQEPAVDTMRTQKDEELERYKRLSERKNTEMAKFALSDDF